MSVAEEMAIKKSLGRVVCVYIRSGATCWLGFPTVFLISRYESVGVFVVVVNICFAGRSAAKCFFITSIKEGVIEAVKQGNVFVSSGPLFG